MDSLTVTKILLVIGNLVFLGVLNGVVAQSDNATLATHFFMGVMTFAAAQMNYNYGAYIALTNLQKKLASEGLLND